MAPDESGFGVMPECCLQEGLSAIAGTVEGIGAQCFSVLAEHGGAIRIVYHWPESGRAPEELRGGEQVRRALERPEPWAAAESAIGEFLNRAATPAAHGFLLAPWPERQWKVVIAFGFGPEQQTGLPPKIGPTIRLAAFAAWIAHEAQRLRRELNVVNERLGRRKTVERAKGLLQARHGWSEQQAYEHLRKLSRQRRRPMADTAQDLLRISPA